MTKHKWHKEIKAWADGLEVQARFVDRKNYNDDWDTLDFSNVEIISWNNADFEFRIKPQPKEPQYLYVYLHDNYELSTIPLDKDYWTYIGRIKLEDTENE